MIGLMQDTPLLISSLLQSAERYSGRVEVVSRRVEGDLHRCTWADVARRARQVANGLQSLGAGADARVASIAWNGHRHLELYYGVSGSGRVMHTINPRLHAEQIAWIVNHAEDEVVCFDAPFWPLVQQVAPRTPGVRHWVMLCEADALPAGASLPGLLCYEDWLAAASADFAWPQFDERTASSLCYTSGTTGDPKGVLYTHRSTLLHTMALVRPDALGLAARDVVLPVVPMFHVNAWGVPYAAAMVGAKLVLPGPALDGASLHALIEGEGVTVALGVPTVWKALLAHVQGAGLRFSTLRSAGIGGAACPPDLQRRFEDELGVTVLHAWGMTETSPLGTASTLLASHVALPRAQQQALRLKQGRPVFGVDVRIVDDGGREQPWDGRTAGHLQVRGPWVLARYFKDTQPQRLDDGWFATGDVATIDEDAYVQLTDRSKDVVKSGGEWLSTIDIENIAMGHPAVALAAAIGMPHPKWDERPVVVVMLAPGRHAAREDILALYEGRLAKWQCPDDVIFVPEIPLGPTGKMLKTRLRQQLAAYVLPELRP